MEHTALDFYKDGSVVLCFITKRIHVEVKLTKKIRDDINDFAALAFSNDLLGYENIFLEMGRHSFDFVNGWRFHLPVSALNSKMVPDEYGIWWDTEEMMRFLLKLENK